MPPGATSAWIAEPPDDLALLSHLFNTAIKEWGLESLSNPIEKIKMPTAARARARRLVRDEETRLLEACKGSSCPWLALAVILALETAMRQGELLSTAAVAVLTALPRAINGRVLPITQDNLEGYWRRATKAAEIVDLRFHDLRYEATSRLFEKELNPMEVAAITGHKTLQMLKRYIHLRVEDLARRLG